MARDPRVDAYLADLPDDQRAALEDLRAAVERFASEAVETISYGMPAFRVHGRYLLGYAAWKSHCSLYPTSDSVPAALAAELEPFRGTKGSLHFTPQRPLSDDLLARFVQARLAAE